MARKLLDCPGIHQNGQERLEWSEDRRIGWERAELARKAPNGPINHQNSPKQAKVDTTTARKWWKWPEMTKVARTSLNGQKLTKTAGKGPTCPGDHRKGQKRAQNHPCITTLARKVPKWPENSPRWPGNGPHGQMRG